MARSWSDHFTMPRVANRARKRPSIVQSTDGGARAASGGQSPSRLGAFHGAGAQPRSPQELAGAWRIFRCGVPSPQLRAQPGKYGDVCEHLLRVNFSQLAVTAFFQIKRQASSCRIVQRMISAGSIVEKQLAALLIHERAISLLPRCMKSSSRKRFKIEGSGEVHLGRSSCIRQSGLGS